MSPPPRPAGGGAEGGGAIDRWQPNGLSAHSLDLRRLLLNEICEGRDGGRMSGRRVEKAKKLSDGRRPRCGLLLLTAGVDKAEWCFSVITLENDTADQRAAKHPGKKMQESQKTRL